MMSIISTIIIVIASIIGTVSAVACINQIKRANAQAAAAATGKKLSDTEIADAGLSTSTKIIFIILVIGVSYPLSNTLGKVALSIILAIILIVGITKARRVTEGVLATAIFGSVGLPFATGLVVRVITELMTSFVWSKLLWFAVPILFYGILGLVGMSIKNESVKDTAETEEDAEEAAFSPLPYIIGVLVIIALIVGGFFAVKHFVKKDREKAEAVAAEQEQRELEIALEKTEAAQKAKAEAEEAEAKEAEATDGLSAIDAINLAFANHGLSEEEKALAADMVLPQLDPKDSESKLTDYALGPISEEMLSPMREWLGWEVDWSSYPVNPVTDQMMTTARTHSAKELGYVDYTMSYATAKGFPKDWKAFAKSRSLSENCTEKDAVIRWVGDLTGNYPAFIGMVELFAEAKTLGTKNRDIKGNEFFDEILDLAKKAEEDNKGITAFLADDAKPAYSKYNFDWQTYRAKFMCWLMLSDFQGRKDWWTSEKSYLGPADNTVSENMVHKFDYANAAYIRPNFTTAKDRQTNLPSYPFCFKDKNGYRVSDFFGVNCANADAELYTEQPAASKAKLKNQAYKPTQQPSGSTVISTAGGTVKKQTGTTSKKENGGGKKKTTPTVKKDPAKSSVNNPPNIIDGKNPIGQGTDLFQPIGSTPTNWGATVPAAQYQPTPETQKILESIEKTGDKPNPGHSSVIDVPDGTYHEVVTNPGGGSTTVTEEVHTNPDTGVTTVNETVTVTDGNGNSESSFTENKEASTPEIEHEDDHDNDGDSESNDSMPDGDF